jgi:hypothetical protein
MRIIKVGETEFLDIEGVIAIPVSRIKRFDFTVANGGATGRSVQIVTDDPDEEIILVERCQELKDFLNETES